MAGLKDFYEALKDGFQHINQLTDPAQIQKMRQEGVLVESEGYWSFSFGEKGEYELCIEPILDEDMFYVSLYKHKVLLTEKLPVKALIKET